MENSEAEVAAVHPEPDSGVIRGGGVHLPAQDALAARATSADPYRRPEPKGGRRRDGVGICRLLLVDDHIILRRGLRALLELEPDLAVVGEAGTFDEAIELARQLQPDVALTDIGLPGHSGLSLVGALRAVAPRVKVLLLTAHGTEEHIRAGLDAHADGYVLKDAGAAELLLGIRTVASGQQYLCKTVTTRVLQTYLRGSAPRARLGALQGLTDRECQVLALIAAGRSNKSIARELALSVKTVEKHRANLMRKLGLHNAAAVTRFALAHDVVAAESRYADG